MQYIIPIVIFAVIGLLAGILLTVASKVFEVETDPRTDEVNEALPQVNCGACGYSGCADYAKAIVENGEKVNLCKPGGNASAEKIADIMDVKAEAAEAVRAVVRCSGNCNTEKTDFEFQGVDTCKNAKRFYGGMWGCKYGCIGLGDCVNVCPENAVSIKDGLASVCPEKCIGCELCAKICPVGIIDIRRVSAQADVLCSSKDMGKNVKAVCSAGCIGCKLCEKNCGFDAIHVKDNIAVIDYDKCTSCGECVKKCPVKVIHFSQTAE